MNWSIKDENMKNRLWSERCQKDLAAASRGPRAVWNVQPLSMQRHVLSRDVNDRSKRFLNGGPSLLASLSRFVQESNATPQADFVRSFTALRKEKTSRPALRAHGNRAASASLRQDVPAAIATGAHEEDHFPSPAVVPEGAVPVSLSRTSSALAHRPTTANDDPVTSFPVRRDFRRPLSAMMVMSAAAPPKPKWRHPVASSDVYGWQPTENPSPDKDPRFQHPLSTTDVTRMGCMGQTRKK